MTILTALSKLFSLISRRSKACALALAPSRTLPRFAGEGAHGAEARAFHALPCVIILSCDKAPSPAKRGRVREGARAHAG